MRRGYRAGITDRIEPAPPTARQGRSARAPTFGERVIAFNRSLRFDGALPPGFAVVNPFRDLPETLPVMERFYRRFYGDDRPRRLILGINPSRKGAGITGVPFTDTKNLHAVCGIEMTTARSHEVSSVFVYEVIRAYGGPQAFFGDCYINSPFPLAIVRDAGNGRWLNANYYDRADLFASTRDFMIRTLRRHVALGADPSHVFVLGKKNAQFIAALDASARLFDRVTVLEHPRYIQQYRSASAASYVDKYVQALRGAGPA